MTDVRGLLWIALADRYCIERERRAGGMAPSLLPATLTLDSHS